MVVYKLQKKFISQVTDRDFLLKNYIYAINIILTANIGLVFNSCIK